MRLEFRGAPCRQQGWCTLSLQPSADEHFPEATSEGAGSRPDRLGNGFVTAYLWLWAAMLVIATMIAADSGASFGAALLGVAFWIFMLGAGIAVTARGRSAQARSLSSELERAVASRRWCAGQLGYLPVASQT